jgi:NAD(P)-dependent dehydrogenase (short-subunit alcohol dehydrogenase family)
MMLQGKVGVVTGAGAGLGLATAIAMAREGAAVVVTGRDPAAGGAVVAEIQEQGGRAVFETVDVIDEEAIQRMVARALSEFGRLDVAYNNAGIESPACPVQDLDMAAVKAAYDINLFSILECMKYEIPAMLEGGGGAIVNATSVWGLNAGAERATYISAKHAISGLTKSAALELAKKNIRVNAVAPGPILTPMLLRDWQGDVEKAAGGVPMGRVGEANEVAEAVVWLCSDRASYITGHVLPIDGGMMCKVG